MSAPFVAEIRVWPGTFAPRGFAFCNGQILSIQQNTALFSLIGTYYGGNGTSNFALPNLQGSVPVCQGQGPGLSPYSLGQTSGTSGVTLNTTQIPAHTHAPTGTSTAATSPTPGSNLGSYFAEPPGNARRPGNLYGATANVALDTSAVTPFVGGNQPHNNLQPYLTLNFMIALVGIYPARN